MVRDIGDTTVQLSWSRGFDNHSPIAKYTLQARTPPAGKWKQVRTSECGPLPALSTQGLAVCQSGLGRAGAEPGAAKRDQRGRLPAGSSQAGGEMVSHGQQERRVDEGRAQSAP